MTRPLFMPLKMHGLVFDLNPEDVPADRFTNGMNVFFKNGDMYRCEGIGAIFGTELFNVDICWYVDTGIQEWWLYASGAGIGVTDGTGTHWDITPASGWGAIASKNFVFTAGDLNSVPWINHPERGAWWWDADVTHRMVKLPDWPAAWSARVMVAHKNFLFALSINTGTNLLESQVSWSSSADPGLIPSYWVPSPTNDAGDWSFATPGGEVVGAISVRDQLFVSKSNATAALQYVGGSFVFQARTVFPTTGLYAPLSQVQYGNLVYMLTGAGEFIRHDGNTIQNLFYGVAQDYLNRAINAEFPASCFAYVTDQNGVVALAYPASTTKVCTAAIGVEVASIGGNGPPDVGIRELPGVTGASLGYTEIVAQSWDSDAGQWDADVTQWNEQATGYRPAKVVFAGGAQGMLELGKTTTVLGQPVTAFAERLGLDFEDFGVHKVISGAFPRLDGSNGDQVYFRFGSQEQVDATIEWGTEMAYTIGTSHQLDFFEEGRLLAFSVRSDNAAPWRLNGVEIMARKAGRW